MNPLNVLWNDSRVRKRKTIRILVCRGPAGENTRQQLQVSFRNLQVDKGKTGMYGGCSNVSYSVVTPLLRFVVDFFFPVEMIEICTVHGSVGFFF